MIKNQSIIKIKSIHYLIVNNNSINKKRRQNKGIDMNKNIEKIINIHLIIQVIIIFLFEIIKIFRQKSQLLKKS